MLSSERSRSSTHSAGTSSSPEYGFSKARNCFLVHNGHAYDSKAIVGAAHGYQHPQLGPMCTAGFSGGDATVRPRLEALGFIVVVTEPTFGPVRPLKLFHDYSRREVHDIFAESDGFTAGAGTWGLAGIIEQEPGDVVLFVTFGRAQADPRLLLRRAEWSRARISRNGSVLEASSRSAESVTRVDFLRQ